MNVLIDLAMNSIGTILFLSGLFTFWQTNLLFYWTLRPLYKKSSIFEMMKIARLMIVYTLLSIAPTR